MRILIAGGAGMLATDVIAAAARAGHETIALSHGELDVADRAEVERRLGDERFDAIANCAAYTNVDGAEEDREGARAVNVSGAGNLAALAAQRRVPLLHVSTDYVFDGRAPRDDAGRERGYLESDPTSPLSVYGETKLEGERLVLDAARCNLVVRSSWLFGVAGGNFVETMLRLAEDRETVDVVDDQVGCPTWTGHLAPALIGLLERERSGLVHLAGAGRVSWNGFAREIFRQAERACEARPVSSERFARLAPRPSWSVLESERDDVIPMPDWRDGLGGYLAAREGVVRI
ncbi:MAG: dTDP-4-dehydrorhamnose reductase [Solirubrobacteraceae bacterium]